MKNILPNIVFCNNYDIELYMYEWRLLKKKGYIFIFLVIISKDCT